MAEPIIRLDNVSLSYDSKIILRDVDLSLHRGDFLAITGPNGGGKTTLLRIMLKLLKPDRGRVCWYDKEGQPVNRLNIGYLPQKSMIDTRFPISVRETVMQGLLKGFFFKESSTDRQRYEEVAELCGLGEYQHRAIGELSGGQLQRTLLARAIISNPELIVFDEPLSYVDKEFEYRIYSLVEQLAKQATIVLVSHEMSVISRLADRQIRVDHKIIIEK